MPKPILLLVFLSGCAAQLRYVEKWPLKQPAARTVRVDVSDERPPDQGGDNPRQVGIARGGYGNPVPFENDDPLQLTKIIKQATVDALHGAGVEAAEQAPFVLRARMRRFWMDGYVAYSAESEVHYELLGAAGTVVWSQTAKGNAAGAVFSYGAASDLLNEAVDHLASFANAQFRRDEFQKALAGAAPAAL